MTELIIVKPDDMHLHLREGDILKYACKDTAKQFARAIVMPNLKTPIKSVNQAERYYKDIKNIPYMWMPKWSNSKDSNLLNPSNRTIVL